MLIFRSFDGRNQDLVHFVRLFFLAILWIDDGHGPSLRSFPPEIKSMALACFLNSIRSTGQYTIHN